MVTEQPNKRFIQMKWVRVNTQGCVVPLLIITKLFQKNVKFFSWETEFYLWIKNLKATNVWFAGFVVVFSIKSFMLLNTDQILKNYLIS